MGNVQGATANSLKELNSVNVSKPVMNFRYAAFFPSPGAPGGGGLGYLKSEEPVLARLRGEKTKGIFSFSIYENVPTYDRNPTGSFSLGSISPSSYRTYNNYRNPTPFINISKKNPFIYIIGITSYLSMILTHEKWAGWSVLIYTDKLTFERNLDVFTFFARNGAILVITELMPGPFNLKPVLRLNRFYPLFIEGITCPVFVRDADTIFEYQLAKEIADSKHYQISFKGQNFLFPNFVKKLNEWESKYYDKIIGFKNKVVFSYDGGNYYFEKDGEKQVRIMAGIVSKIGESLPIELWNKELPTLLLTYKKQLLENKLEALKEITINNSLQNDVKQRLKEQKVTSIVHNYEEKLNWIDEVYLSDVIYKWCKENDRAEFFKMNIRSDYYVNESGYARPTEQYLSIIDKYFKKYNESRKSRMAFFLNPEINFGLSGKTKYWVPTHEVHSEIHFEHPDISLNDDYFYNPLTGNKDKKPSTIPLNYKFGGTKRRRATKKITRKKRNGKSRAK